MSSRRAIISELLAKRCPERMGLHEHFWPYIGENAWYAQGYPKGTDSEHFFDLDIHPLPIWVGAAGPRPDLKAVLEEDAESRLVRSDWGAVTRTWKYKAGTPEHVDFMVTRPDVWYREFREPFRALKPLDGTDFAKLKQALADRRADDRFVTIGGLQVFELMRAIMGDVAMLEAVLLEPDWVQDFCTCMIDHLIATYARIFQEVGLPDGIHIYEDLGYTQAAFVSPSCHCALVLPHHQRLFRFFKDHGLPIIFHTCGDFRPHLPAIVAAGADCIQALEAKTGMDVVALAKEWKDRLCFMGNLDVRAFESGDRRRIASEVVGKIEGMKALRAPYIVMSDHSIPPSVHLDDYRYALDLMRRNCHY